MACVAWVISSGCTTGAIAPGEDDARVEDPGALSPAGDPLPTEDASPAPTAEDASVLDTNVSPPTTDGGTASDSQPTAVDAPPPDTAKPDTANPDTAKPDTAKPDTAVADTAVPDTAAPDTAVADTGSSVDSGVVSSAWRKANLTYYTSYPDPGSEECIKYSGCEWAGQFAALSSKMPESWVAANNIASVHSKDFATYKLKTLRLRQGDKQIDVKVYDECADSDCSGCCTANSKSTGFLIDLESYTAARFGTNSGIVEWVCLDC